MTWFVRQPQHNKETRMNKRQAKRDACFRAANVIQTAMSSGWPGEDEGYSEAEAAMVGDALVELITELRRRL